MTAFNPNLAAAIAKQGVPLTADMAPLGKERVAEIEARWAPIPADEHPRIAVTNSSRGGTLLNALDHARHDVPALLAEVQRLTAELGKYVGAEPTIAEEMDYLSSCVHAVHDLCDKAEKQAGRWEHPLPVPEWVEQVRVAASGERPEDLNDRRRRIYIDGKGNGWIDLSVDPDTGDRDLTGITDAWKVASADEVRADTGSLREIGRCW